MAKIIGTAGNDPNLNGTSQADEIYGRGGRDTLRGGGSADKLYGEGEDDTLFGDAGNDLLTGGAGRDTIDGGTDTDTAFYSGVRSDYSISTRNGITTVRDLRSGSPDGTDTLTNVERIEFSDGSILYLTANRAPTLSSETWTVVEDGSHASATSLLANDVDLDGDELELVSVNGTGLLQGTATITLQSGARLTVANTGNYTFETRGVYNHLAEGETATEVITYQVADQFGGLSTATLTIVINGSNDAPVLYAAVSPGLNVTERPNHTTQVNDGSVTTSGTIAFDDVDLSDTHTVAVELLSAIDSDSGPVAGLGSFTPQITNPSTGDGHGAVTWNFAVGNHLIDHLAQGQVITQTYRVTVTDDNGASFTHDVAITITGTNDVPVAAADAGAALEAGIGAGSNATGNVLANDSDVDQGTLLVVSGVNLGATIGAAGSPLQGSYGRLTLNANGSYTYVVDQNNAAVQGLGAASDTLSETFTYQVSDGDGGTATANLTITISGQNDAPDIVADSGTALEAGTAAGSDASGNVLDNDRDVDAGDSIEVYSIQAVYEGATFFRVGDTYQSRYGTFTINADGSYSYVVDNDDPAVQALQVGETLTEQFFYNARDDDGWARAAFLTITVQGANDAPTVSGAIEGTATEGAATSTLYALANSSDVDHDTTLSVVNMQEVLPAGVTYDAATQSFTLDPAIAAYRTLGQDQQITITVSYGVSDGIAITPASARWTVTGVEADPASELNVGVLEWNTFEEHNLTNDLAALDVFGSVTRINDFSPWDDTAPQLSELLEFDVIVFTSDWLPPDTSSFGDVLADYVDAGGNLVVTTFVPQQSFGDAQFPSENLDMGRLEDDGYMPIGSYIDNYSRATTALLPEHPLFNLLYDVQSIDAYHRDIVTPSADATVVGYWIDGSPLALIDSSGVIALTVYPVSGYNYPSYPGDPNNSFDDVAGDYIQLVANAVRYSSELFG